MTGRVERQCACLDTRRGGRNDGRETGNPHTHAGISGAVGAALSIVYGHARSSSFLASWKPKKMIQKYKGDTKYIYPHV